MNQILTARWVLPITSAPIPFGYVRIQDGVVRDFGRAAELAASADVIDLGDVVLMPGLINTHTHLELTCYANALPPQSLWSWLGGLIQLRAAPGREEREYQAVINGAWQSLRAGVTTVADISRTGESWRALAEVPIRKVCFIELLSLAQQPPRNIAELKEAFVSALEANTDPLLRFGLSPHAPYTVHRDDFHAVGMLAAEVGEGPWTAHFAETREELRWLCGDEAAIPNPLRDFLNANNLRSPRLARASDYLHEPREMCGNGILAHCNYIAETEFDALRDYTVVYCPRAHAYFGHSPHPFRAMRAAGIRVTLGTDSLASNDSLSLLDELRFVRQLPDPPSDRELLEVVTVEAAQALAAGATGSIEVDAPADLVAFAITDEAVDPYAAVLGAESANRVWVAGSEVDLSASETQPKTKS